MNAPAALSGYTVNRTPFLQDGTVTFAGDGTTGVPPFFLLGTRPWTPLEVAGEQGHRIARHGLADVLEWLGEDVGPHPDAPYPHVTSEEILAGVVSRWPPTPGFHFAPPKDH